LCPLSIMQTAVMQCASAGQKSLLVRAQTFSNKPRFSCHGQRASAPKLSRSATTGGRSICDAQAHCQLVTTSHPHLPCSSAFISTTSSLATMRTPKHQRHCSQRVMAFEREWPDPQFVAEVKEAFPDQGIANVEEARVITTFTNFQKEPQSWQPFALTELCHHSCCKD